FPQAGPGGDDDRGAAFVGVFEGVDAGGFGVGCDVARDVLGGAAAVDQERVQAGARVGDEFGEDSLDGGEEVRMQGEAGRVGDAFEAHGAHGGLRRELGED